MNKTNVKFLRPSRAINQMTAFELVKRKNQLQKLIKMQDDKINDCVHRFGKNMEKNYKKELCDDECQRLNKLVYEGMVLAEKALKRIRSELELVEKHLQAKLLPRWCPKCHQNQLIPDTTVCYDCNIKEVEEKNKNLSTSSLASLEILIS